MADRTPTQETVKEIMCTLTPEQIIGKKGFVSEMYVAGMRSVRINTAHLDSVDFLGELCHTLKTLHPDLRILIDTKGPEMRTTSTADDRELPLAEGDILSVEGSADGALTAEGKIHVNYPQIHEHARAGQRIVIDDARIVLEVTGVDDCTICCKVVKGGRLGSRKGFAIEGVDVPLPAVSARDSMFIKYAASSAYIDVIAHSFVRSADDVEAVKMTMQPYSKPTIAKIENQQGIDNLGGIIQASDGILIARGDLTASIGREGVAAAQKHISLMTKEAGLPLYLATFILPSMMTGTEPDRHDLDGIRDALDQGVDVMLLTNETASGPHPVRSTRVLSLALNNYSAKSKKP